jgi:hypothetical protein
MMVEACMLMVGLVWWLFGSCRVLVVVVVGLC